MREHLDRMLAGQGGTILVGGEAGIGKTTLVEDLSVQAEEAGCLVLWGHAYDFSVTPPYGPWLEIWRQYRRTAAHMPPLPPFIFDVKELAKIGSQETLFAEVSDFLRSAAAKRPLLLVLDDLHWSDQATLDFFRMLARQVSGQRILLLATYRSDELHRRHPLYTLLPLLVREAGAERLDVRQLDKDGNRTLIQERYELDEPDQDRLERYLEDHAEGNPLYAGELLRTLEEANVLRQEGRGWQLANLDRVRIPPLLQQVIEGRLTRLEETTRELLQVAAVIGPTVPVDLWQQVSGASDEALLAAIEQGQAAQLIEETEDDSYRFRHALLREALYEEMVALRRRLWHRIVAESLESQPLPDPDSIAYHYGQARDSRAGAWLVRAGERATRSFAWLTAAARLEAALELSETSRERCWLLYCIGRLRRWTNPRAAVESYREARALAAQVGDAVLHAYCLFDEGTALAFLDEFESALDLMAAGADEIDALPLDHLFSYPGLLDWASASLVAEPVPSGVMLPALNPRRPTYVAWLITAGHLHEAIEQGEAYLQAADAAPWLSDVHTDAIGDDLTFGLSIAYGELARRADQLRLYERWHEAAKRREIPVSAGLGAMFELRSLLQFDTTNLAARQQLIGVMEPAFTKPEESSDTTPSIAHHVLEGRWEVARRIAERIIANLDLPHARAYLYETAELVRQQGDRTLAWSLVAVHFPDGPPASIQHPSSPLTELVVLAAMLALDDGDQPLASRWIELLEGMLEQSGALRPRPSLLMLRARLAQANGDLQAALDFAQQGFDLATQFGMPLANLISQRQLGELLTANGQYARAEDHLRESLRLADACAAPFERALTLLEIAKLRAAQRRTDEARELVSAVRAVCEPLEARPTLERIDALEQQMADKETADA